MSKSKRKHEWTAELVPYGTLAPNPKHPHFNKTAKQRLGLIVAVMRSALMDWLQEHPGFVLRASNLASEVMCA